MVPVSLPGLVQMLWMLQGVENTIQYEVTTPDFAARSLGDSLVMDMDSTTASVHLRNNLLFGTDYARFGWKVASSLPKGSWLFLMG